MSAKKKDSADRWLKENAPDDDYIPPADKGSDREVSVEAAFLDSFGDFTDGARSPARPKAPETPPGRVRPVKTKKGKRNFTTALTEEEYDALGEAVALPEDVEEIAHLEPAEVVAPPAKQLPRRGGWASEAILRAPEDVFDDDGNYEYDEPLGRRWDDDEDRRTIQENERAMERAMLSLDEPDPDPEPTLAGPGACGNPFGCPNRVKAPGRSRCSACAEYVRTHGGEERPQRLINRGRRRRET